MLWRALHACKTRTYIAAGRSIEQVSAKRFSHALVFALPVPSIRSSPPHSPYEAMAMASGLVGLAGSVPARRLVAVESVHEQAVGALQGTQAVKRLNLAAVGMSIRPSILHPASMHAVRASASSFQAAETLPQGSVDVEKPVVSSQWLHSNLQSEDVKVLDASWYMPAEGRSPRKEYEVSHIPKALFFDLDKIVDLSSNLPHMLPSEDAFAAAVSALGIQNKDLVVVYDGKGIFSAARVWWMFRVFGHEKVVVLDGGLPGWRAAGYEAETGVATEILDKVEASTEAVRNIHDGDQALPTNVSFKAVLQPNLVWSLEQVKQNIEEHNFELVDARSKARFDGTAPEPRAGIRGGHVPGSKCVPFTEVLSNEGKLLPKEDIEKKFTKADIAIKGPVVTSCGTGVTACILALALFRLGKKDVPVYDGSWTEWGLSPDTPVSVTKEVTRS